MMEIAFKGFADTKATQTMFETFMQDKTLFSPEYPGLHRVDYQPTVSEKEVIAVTAPKFSDIKDCGHMALLLAKKFNVDAQLMCQGGVVNISADEAQNALENFRSKETFLENLPGAISGNTLDVALSSKYLCV